MSIKRRTVLAAGGGVLGATGLALAGCGTSGGSASSSPSASASQPAAADGTCVLTSELTEGLKSLGEDEWKKKNVYD